MYRDVHREGRFFRYEKECPSFSSSLLDKIYRSIDDDRDKNSNDLRIFRETIAKKKSNRRTERDREEEQEDEDMASFRRACFIEKWMDKKVAEKVVAQRRRQYHHHSDSERKFSDRVNYGDATNDVPFFSSTSSSSDSSSGGFSSSDTESMFGAGRSAPSSYSVPAMPYPVRTIFSEKKQSEIRVRNVSCYKPESSRIIDNEEEAMVKSKSRALKIYNKLRKVKQPISPGGKLASFLNSLFASKTTNAAPANSKIATATTTTPFREAPPSTACSSASSYSRSCLSKSTPSTRGGLKRSVRFYPVSVIVGEDSRPCGHKSIYQDQNSVVMPVSVPTAWKIGRKMDESSEVKVQSDKSSWRVEETAREFLRDYRRNEIKNELMIVRDQLIRSKDDIAVPSDDDEEEIDDDMDDSASYSSSDLFELDHLSVIGKEVRFQEELPVYETTRIDRNRAIF